MRTLKIVLSTVVVTLFALVVVAETGNYVLAPKYTAATRLKVGIATWQVERQIQHAFDQGGLQAARKVCEGEYPLENGSYYFRCLVGPVAVYSSSDGDYYGYELFVVGTTSFYDANRMMRDSLYWPDWTHSDTRMLATYSGEAPAGFFPSSRGH